VTKASKSTRRFIVRGKGRDDVEAFLSNVLDRKFTDAERALKALQKRNFGDPEFKKGYVAALEGILLSERSGDERDFFNNVTSNPDKMKKYKEEFIEFNTSPVRTSFDMGFFSAWTDLIQYRLNIK
jgi:hypothetical protein